jgi:hypothetical protein
VKAIRFYVKTMRFLYAKSMRCDKQEISMLKMGAIPGKDYHTGPTTPILSMLISCLSQRMDFAYKKRIVFT